MKWTKMQESAIQSYGSNILVAAAAGSGKTAVLTERVIKMVTQPDNKINIDDLLIVTFTEAVASEMKQKISSKINEFLQNDPSNKHLRKQSILVNRASISTVHSFCMGVIKNNVHLTDLPANFSLLSEDEAKIMKLQTIDEVFDFYYQTIDENPAFLMLCNGYSGTRDDSMLKNIILSLRDFVQSVPFPEEWLKDAVYEYSKDFDDFKETIWGKIIFDTFKSSVLWVEKLYTDALDVLMNSIYNDTKYIDVFLFEQSQVKDIISGFDNLSWDGIIEKLYSFTFGDLSRGPRGSKEEGAKAEREIVKKLRDEAKDEITKLRKKICLKTEDIKKNFEFLYPMVDCLKNITLDFEEKYRIKKVEKNKIDFNDLEHYTIDLLVEKTDDGYSRTALAERIAEKYIEIFIDEYQDSNMVQEFIFQSVSQNNNNIFMVGDIKQSIYRFRNAMPSLFLDKYNIYDDEINQDSFGKRIKLYQNFRSRDNIINFVNFVFENIMSKSVGDLDYNKDESLILGAEYEDVGVISTEVNIISKMVESDYIEDEDDEQTEDLDKIQKEAIVTAERIRLLVDNKELTIFDKEAEKYRAVEYRDIVILSGKTKGVTGVFEEIFQNYKIPLYSDVGGEYLSSIEVVNVLSFLQVIDNPLQDIPLIGVMRSPIFGFNDEELALIREKKRSGYFYDAVKESAKSGNEKCRLFLLAIVKLRSMAENYGIEQIIDCIYFEYNYFAIAGSMENGIIRQANLRLLFERAGEFEKSGLRGLFNFVNFINTLSEKNSDLKPAKIASENQNAVRMMSIHKSKGLEFPVVFVVLMGNRFNEKELSGDLLWHENYGIGAKVIDFNRKIKVDSLPRYALEIIKRRESRSEQMRLLYVAFTRAREKLILIGTVDNVDKTVHKSYGGFCDKTCDVDKKNITDLFIQRQKTFYDWLFPVFMKHSGGAPLRQLLESDFYMNTDENDCVIKVNIMYDNEIKLGNINSKNVEQISDDTVDNFCDISKILDFEYKYKNLCEVPAKLSVTEIKRQMETEDDLPVNRVDFLSGKNMIKPKKMNAQEVGIVTHFIMQHILLNFCNTYEEIEKQVSKMIYDGMITENQAEMVNVGRIFEFFKSDIGKRMILSSNIKREVKFYIEFEPEKLHYHVEESDEKILLQGVVDCYFEEDDGIVIVDYKTDKVSVEKAEKAAYKYKTQLEYYSIGLKDMLQKPVKARYIHFLSCGLTVEV